MSREKLILIMLLFTGFISISCSSATSTLTPPVSTPTPTITVEEWFEENEPDRVYLENTNFPSKPISLSTITLKGEFSSYVDSWEVVYGEDNELLASGDGETFQFSHVFSDDGKYVFRLTMIKEVEAPEQYNENEVEIGPRLFQYNEIFSVVVDTTPPELVKGLVVKKQDVFVISGIVSDDLSVIAELDMYIGSDYETTIQGGVFKLNVPFDKIGWIGSIPVELKDSAGNSSIWSIPIQLPSTRWEKRDPSGNLLAIRDDPGFDPFDSEVVGFIRWFIGWGDSTWQFYRDNNPVTIPYSIAPSAEKLRKTLGSVALVVLVVVPSLLLLEFLIGIRKTAKGVFDLVSTFTESTQARTQTNTMPHKASRLADSLDVRIRSVPPALPQGVTRKEIKACEQGLLDTMGLFDPDIRAKVSAEIPLAMITSRLNGRNRNCSSKQLRSGNV